MSNAATQNFLRRVHSQNSARHESDKGPDSAFTRPGCRVSPCHHREDKEAQKQLSIIVVGFQSAGSVDTSTRCRTPARTDCHACYAENRARYSIGPVRNRHGERASSHRWRCAARPEKVSDGLTLRSKYRVLPCSPR